MITKIISTTHFQKCNCVLYCRAESPIQFPYGMWTIKDKKRIINSPSPKVGAIAIMNVGVWYIHNGKRVFSGHMGIVEKISYAQKKCPCCGTILKNVPSYITIREANYVRCAITRRSGTSQELKILGFRV